MSNSSASAPPPSTRDAPVSACEPRHAVHDLRNLLAQIQGYAGMLLERAPRGEAEREAGAILAACQRATDLCSDLMRFGHAGWRPERARFDPAALLNTVEALFVDGCTPTGVALRFEAEPGLPPLTGDFRLVERGLLNLIWNALAVVDAAGGSVQVRAEAAPAGEVCFRVRDDGPGLPDELAGDLTEHRPDAADWGRDRDGSLHGFGLLIAAQAARVHRGRLQARNHSAGGAELSLHLPVQQ